MENQHRKLDEIEIASINEVRQVGIQLDELIRKLLKEGSTADKRWVGIGKTQLQKGIMALTRSIAKPDFF